MKNWLYKAVCFTAAFSVIITSSTYFSFAASKSAAPDPNNITVTNNTRTRDTINITGLSGGDTVKVYKTATSTGTIGRGKVSSYSDELTISISQLGTEAGSVYVTVTGNDEEESERVKVDYEAEGISDDPLPENISIENNSGMSDVIYVTGLSTGDVVKVYSSAKGGKTLGTATMSANKTEAAVKIGQLGADGGSIFVSVMSAGLRESNRIEVQFSSEPKSDEPFADCISITNNAGTADTVYVTSLSEGDTVKVYNAEKGGKQMGSATVGNNKDDATVKIAQLGARGGTAFISVTNKGRAESNRVKVDFQAEQKTYAINPDYITVTNNCLGTTDTVEVIGVSESDTVRVYSAAAGGKLLGTAVAPANAYKLSVNIPQVGLSDGYIYVTVTSKGMSESDRVSAAFTSEPKSIPPSSDNIAITNNAGTPDTVAVSCISAGDVVKVYDKAKAGRLIGTASVPSNQSGVTVNIPQIGTGAGTLYISLTSKGENESDRVSVAYSGEVASSAISVASVAITNNASNIADTIQVSNLSAGDIIKVYDSSKGGIVLGTATVASGKTDATITVTQLGSNAGKVYLTVTGKNRLESGKTEIAYAAEASSYTPNTKNIFITNNAGSADTIYVTGLVANDVVNVYDSINAGTALVSGTAAGGKTAVTMSVPQLGEASGSIYVSITSKGKNASGRVKVDYAAETVTNDPDGSNIIITNNAGIADTVEVTALNTGDLVNVYDSADNGKLLGTATAENKKSVIISIPQLGENEGKVYISVTNQNKQESTRLEVPYVAEARTNAPAKENIAVNNNPAGIADTVDIIGLNAGDTVNVYDAAAGGNLLGSVVVQSGKTFATVSINQLGIASGKVYITVTGLKKQESSRIEKTYEAEPETAAPDSSKIVVTNNPAGINDTVFVPNISAGDIVNVYDSALVGKLLGSQTASGSDSSITVTIPQLGRYSGKVYVTLTGKNRLESSRVEVSYSDEAKTNKIAPDNVSITNNAGTSDTVSVRGVTAGDVIKVYDAATGGTLLGQASVANGNTSGSISNLELGASAGKVYLTLTNKNKLESDTTEVSFDAESQTPALSDTKIFVTNNAGTDDIVKVTGLSAGDTVKVYDSQVGGTMLGTGKVSSYKSEVSVTIAQLGTERGSIYVSLTGNKNQLESDRTKADYSAEPVSGAPAAQNISVANNAGMVDTVKVIGLSSGDTVNIYDAINGGNLLSTVTAASGKTEAIASIDQLGTGEGKIYVSLTGINKLESDRTEIQFTAESKSSVPDTANITVINYAGKAASITLTKLTGNDTVNVYSDKDKANLIGSGTVQQYYTETTFDISQLSSSPGEVYVTVTSRGKLESDAVKVTYGSKPQSGALDARYIAVTNNAGIADTISITNLNEGDIIKVYRDLTSSSPLKTAVVDNGQSEVSFSITQLGTEAGKIYITVTNAGKLEGTRTEIGYNAEKSSVAPAVGNITVTVNAGGAGTVKVTGLVMGDTVKVYDNAVDGNLLGTAAMTATSSQVVVNIPSLSNSGGYVYVSVKGTGKTESSRTAAGFNSVSAAPLESSITINNNVDLNDTIAVANLSANDLVKVYDSAQGGTLLGKAICSGSQAVVSIPQLTENSGTVYITVTSFGKSESARTEVDYAAEQYSNTPYLGNITVVNNAGIPDTVSVTELAPNDVVIVYDMSNGGTMLGYSIVPSGNTQAVVKINNLGSTSGTVYVSVINIGKYESGRTAVKYTAEQSTTAPFEGDISVINSSTSGTVTVKALSGGDIVKIYDSAEGGTLLGVATVSSTGNQVSISVSSLAASGGSVYVSVTSIGKNESSRTRVSYMAR